MMKLLEIALVLVSLAFLAVGGEGMYHAARDHHQVELSCEEFVREPSRASWVRITGCTIDYLGAGYDESNAQITGLFLPARPKTQPAGTPAPLVIATRDADVLALVQATVKSAEPLDQDSFVVLMLRIVTMLRVSREVEGYTRGGVERFIDRRRALSAVSAPLAPRFVVVDVHPAPSIRVPAVVAATGVVLLVLAAALGRRRSSAPVEEPEAVVDTAALPPVAEAPRRIPAVMLLNLDASAGPADIEGAPPLGTRDEVLRRMDRMFPDLHFDPDGRGTLRGPDWSLAVDVGRGETVWTVTAEPRGDGSLGPLQTLARGTDWRIYIPRRGEFVDAAHLKQVSRPPES